MQTDLGNVLSPATVLEHEGSHALDYNTDKGNAAKLAGTENNNYDTALEKRAIEGPEQKTARANGEIGLLESTRLNHNGLPVIVPSSTSTTVKKPETFKFLENLYYKGVDFKGMDYRKFKK